MTTPLRSTSLAFAAGTVGALLNSLTVATFGALGITAAAGVAIAPSLTPSWLYPRLVWGGLWGALLLLPLAHRRWLVNGCLLALGPTVVQLVLVFPRAGKGLAGLELGALTPIFVFVFNLVWAWAAIAWFRRASR